MSVRLGSCLLLFHTPARSSNILLLKHKSKRREDPSSSLSPQLHLLRNSRIMVARCTFKSDDIVVKSPNDKKLYRVLELDNGLCALLVHDPEVYPDGVRNEEDALNDDDREDEEEDYEDEEEEDDDDGDDEDFDEEDDDGSGEEVHESQTRRKGAGSSRSIPTKKAAAAMCVGVGSFSDPIEAQGLAHFLEHMLFMGSSAFPDENEYDSYLSKHGGSSNAYTETEHTCYHFEVKNQALKGALERFSKFFISPLVKMEAMDREVLAVDSEFNQVMQSDSCRLQQLQCHTSSVAHPFKRFVWGNKKSFANALDKGINLRERILQMYKDWYHGGLMKLCVIGGESLDVLESWVTELFANVKNGTPERPQFNVLGPIWETGQIYRLEAVKDNHTLELNWVLPCLSKEYRKKAEDYLAHLLGHEGGGSLLSFLKSRGLAMSLSAGVGDEGMHRSSVAYIFGMSIRLTDYGLQRVFDIIGYVYQYLKLIKQVTPQEWIFKELQDIGNMEFRFTEDQSQDDYAAELAENMLIYPTRHIIYGDYVYEHWDGEMIKYLLEFFKPNNMRVDVVSKSFQNLEGLECEPWFGSRYSKEAIPDPLMRLWKDPQDIEPAFHLPSMNDFIPRDFSIYSENENGTLSGSSSPKCLIDEPLMKLWYKLDRVFKLPRSNTYFRINLKGGYSNLRSSVMSELFVLLLKDELNEVLYQASIAKLETSVSLVADKVELKVYGFNEKVAILLSKILSIAKSFSPSEERFKVMKEDLERSLKNANMKPLSHSSYLRLQVLFKCFYEAEEKLSILSDLSLSDLKATIIEFLSQVYISGLCHGNVTEDGVKLISSLFRSNLTSHALPSPERYQEQIMQLPTGSNLARDVCVKNKSEKNSVLELYFQIEPDVAPESIRLKALIDLFHEIVEEPLFNQLRTKEQLGYVVECSPRVTHRIYGFCFCVQSAEYSPIYLQERVDHFINGLGKLLEDLDDSSFQNFKKGLVAKLMEKDPSLLHETNRYWNHIVDERFIFDFSEREVEQVEVIEKSDVIKWYGTYLQRGSPKCRRLAVRVWGCAADAGQAAHNPFDETLIHDLPSFKASSLFYPSFC